MSTSGSRRIDEIGNESRRRILDAAEDLFTERGFERTSFAEIAERSGISRGSIPWHFKNKHGLFLAVIERAMDRAMAPERRTSFPTLADLAEEFSAWVRNGDSTLVFMALTEAMHSSGAVHGQYQEFFAQHRHGLERWLRAQRPASAEAGTAAKREHAFAVAFTGTLFGIHLQALVDPDNVDFEEAIRLVAAEFGKDLRALWDDAPVPSDPGQ
ncbi:TetR/AcrR family transcriptional regulator [Streptomyces sp. 8L]|uniref:TetR/AcrR family transcriptional regulator n=1 Tax=Streptomyces sp. 8L TaxID=2877242 RepID=UPI001CD64AD3|nr:TetR/AcrR family transcriptional regulator [Streptomyces sp. 8L]MCA1222143.1 TetR/AcrR family transcriptional regulator [Streptomyces sp. 8L]